MKFLKDHIRSLVILLVCAALMQAAEYYGLLTSLNAFTLDRILHNKTTAEFANKVSTLEIDQAAFRSCFASHANPLDPQQVVALIRAVAEAHPAVIGVDILTDLDQTAPVYQRFEAELPSLPSKTVWISGFNRNRFEVSSFLSWLAGGDDELIVRPAAVFGYPPGELADHHSLNWGLPVYAPDSDAAIRRSLRSIQASADPQHSAARETIPSFPQRVTNEYCMPTIPCAPQAGHEILITYGPPYLTHNQTRFNVLDLFHCPTPHQVAVKDPAQLKKAFAGRIVLLGGAFSGSGDNHEIAGRENIPGLLINAYAIRAMIAGESIQEVSQPWAWLLDLAMGLFVLFAFEEPICHSLEQLKGKFKGGGKMWWVFAANLAAWVIVLSFTQAIWGEGYVLGLIGTLGGTLIGILADAIIYARSESAESRETSDLSR